MASEVQIILSAVDRASAEFAKVQGSLGKLSGFAQGAFTVGMSAAVAGVGAITAGLAFSVKEAMEAQEVQARLTAVLKSTGGAAGVSAEMANNLANSLMGVTRFSDETILSVETMLLRFQNIGKDIFPQVTEASLDLAESLGIDAESAARMLGKALEVPGEGLLRLKMAGVSFTDEQQKMIDGMVAAGDIAGAQKLILDSLQKSIGGTAKAMGQTFSGQLTILKNSLLNIAESIGTALLPILQKFLNDVVIPAIPYIQELANRFIEWFGTLQNSAFMEQLQAITGAIVNFVQTAIIPFVTTYAEEFKGALIAIGVVLAGAAIVGGILTLVGAITALATPITLIIGVIALLGAAWAGNWGGIQEKTAAVIAFLQGLIQGFLSIVQTWWQAHATQIQAIVSAMTGIISSIFAAFKAAFEGDWYSFGENLRAAWDQAWKLIAQALTAAWGLIKAGLSTIISNTINAFKNTDWGSVGRAVIDGIARGIKSGASAVINAAIAVAKAAIEAVKGFLGIQSPSKVFAGIGKQMMAGMAEGIEKAQILPIHATIDAARLTTDNTRGNSLRGGSIGGDVYATFIINATPNQSEAGIARQVLSRLKDASRAMGAGAGYAGG